MRSSAYIFVAIVLASFCFQFTGLMAQNLDRMEIPVKPTQDIPDLLPAGSHGFFLITTAKGLISTSPKGASVTVTRYDTAFREQWSKSIGYNKRLELQLYEYQDDALFMVFNSESREELEIVKVSLSGVVDIHRFFYLKRLIVSNFIARDGQAFLAGTLKRLPVALRLDLANNRIRPMPMAFGGKSAVISELAFAPDGSLTAVVLLEQQRKRSVIVRNLGENGEALEDLQLNPDKNYGLLSAKVTTLTPTEQIVMGTYAVRKDEAAQGFYMGKFNTGEREFFRYHDFCEPG